MNNKDYAVYQALEGVATFGTTHAASFPADSEGVKDFARPESGVKLTMAVERLMGMLLVMIAVQMFLNGLEFYLER